MNFLRNKYDTVENVIILYTVSPTTECLLSTIFLSFYKYLIIGCVIPTVVDAHLIKYVFLNIRNNLLPYLLSKYYYYLFQIRIDWKLKNTHFNKTLGIAIGTRIYRIAITLNKT